MVYLSAPPRTNHKPQTTLQQNKQNSWHFKAEINILPPRTEETAYKALVHPTLEYRSSVWDPHTAKNTNTVEMVQTESCTLGSKSLRPQR